MAKTKTKGTAKTVSDTPVPQPITISSTNPKIMADNIKKLEKAIKGADDASEISYDNTTSHLTASNVQAAIDEVVADIGSLAAEDVSYDNTDSGLTADNVQAAIDELKTNTAWTLIENDITTESDPVDVSAYNELWVAPKLQGFSCQFPIFMLRINSLAVSGGGREGSTYNIEFRISIDSSGNLSITVGALSGWTSVTFDIYGR